ncbi:MAG: glycosyltransferase family 2 protein [Methylotenera sp.]|uniref:glycosyltransferase family 2 protein n=1 Tax=Methylotenera sp. TaxID=2051956 RepID=UPI0027279736|nr:glycosyltransferase family 2 protein [Methylotenera sp.]MDO9393295.1 glycosyltransferase family 2 protein [Methylotenera sp.]
MDISVIIVSFNTIEMTKKALDCLFVSVGNFKMEVFVIDNASRDQSAEVLRRDYPDITLIENKQNVGFGRANNQAVPLIHSKYVLLLNTDAFVKPDTIIKTMQYMDAHPKCGMVGVKLLGRDGILQPSCRYFPTPWNIFLERTNLKKIFKHVKLVDDMSWDHASVRNCDWVPGCYALIRKEVIDQVGLFDPRYFLYYEEVDHCFAAKRAGWKVAYFPDTPVVHIGGESAKLESAISSKSRQIESLQIESELLYFRKNHGLIGVFVHLLLNSLADFILFFKDFIKLRAPATTFFNLNRALFVWKMFFRTRLATQPTR